MDAIRTFSAASETDLWQQVAADMDRQPDLYDYQADLHEAGYRVRLEFDIDLGGGFEGGYEQTTLTAPVPGRPAFHFALHEQDWLHEIGKLLGLQDVELGDPELDAAFIITTNQPDTLRQLLAPAEVRATLLRFPDARLTLAPASHDAEAEVWLTFTEERAITDLAQLREIYRLLLLLLRQLAPPPAAV